jgi:CO dehydrogenase/acetyl-CoA synthase epsilon subunit
MSVKDPSWLAQHLRSGKRVLIMAGALCDKLDVDGKSLLDYVAEISKKTDAPIAATGNTVTGLRQRGIDVKKAWAIEMANFAHRDWHHPIMEKKPQIMVLIGYSPLLAGNLVSVVKGVETVVLGDRYVEAATYSLPDKDSYKAWRKELDDLVAALGGKETGRRKVETD